ncbi:MAG: tetratricopeptide repeat protein [Paludibacteraceae bacterium]|nr:tetratricopeptide repeat protein [Paludibacteraceae bacterium]
MMCAFNSCHWHEAKEVIATADSLDQTEHVIYDDTAALGRTIRSLDNPFGRVLMSNTLGKAYYYMGRNYSLSNQIAEAADCYINADRLQIDDPIYRGRVHSCMGYICTQNNDNDSLALIFYERASEHFKASDNHWYYAQILLNRSECCIRLHNYFIADSLLQIAKSYLLDSAYQARYYETLGLYFYEQQQYDSALVYFNQGLDYWQSEGEKCFSYLKIMQSYYFRAKDINSAIPYAKLIVEHSTNPNYLSNAYYCLMQDARNKNNLKQLSVYSHTRTDALNLLRKNTKNYAEALPILKDYLHNPCPWSLVWIAVSAFAILCITFVLYFVLYRRYAIAQIHVSNEQIFNLSVQMKEQADELHKHAMLHYHDECLDKIRRKHPKPRHQWNEYDSLKKDVNPYLHDWLIALEKLNLTQRENVFCVLSFIYPQMSIEDLAHSMCITKSALMVRKTRITKKIGITSAQLGDFLYNLRSID